MSTDKATDGAVRAFSARASLKGMMSTKNPQMVEILLERINHNLTHIVDDLGHLPQTDPQCACDAVGTIQARLLEACEMLSVLVADTTDIGAFIGLFRPLDVIGREFDHIAHIHRN